jgi:hypothetical protein
MTYRNSARAHAICRLFDRYAIWITKAEYRELSAMIARGECPKLAGGQGGCTIHKLRIHGDEVWAVYKPEIQAIVTFLPNQTPFELRCPRITQASA